MKKKNDKFSNSILELEEALSYKSKALKERFFFSGIAKCFEVCFEYAWKYMKEAAINNGLEVYSPRDSIKCAGRLGIISDVERWLFFLENRNLAVHDYLGIEDSKYLQIIEEFLMEVKKIKKPS